MKLMTKTLLNQIPELYSSETVPLKDKKIYAKYFGGPFTWYVAEKEVNGDDITFFGYVYNAATPLFSEWGYFTLKQLEAVKLPPFGLGIERDLHFKPKLTHEIPDINRQN